MVGVGDDRESMYQTLLQVAAGKRFFFTTALVNMT
jgi:hypothetical protein